MALNLIDLAKDYLIPAICARISSPACRGNLGRVCGRVLLQPAPYPAAPRSLLQPFLPNVNIPPECATRIRLVNCDLSVSPPHCRATAVTYRKGCEQVMAVK